ncbi:MAG: tripartite tricarboxylate transporter TctB family protein, partial [Burkholderiales bacterium]
FEGDPQASQRLLPRGAALRRVIVLLAALAGVALLLEPLGFRLVVAMFCLLLLPALGARNYLVVVIFAVAASFGVYALFSDLLKVPLPIGSLGI